MEAFLEKATSALTEAKDSVEASLTDAQKTVAASVETIKTEAAATTETIKTEAAASADTVETEAAASAETFKSEAGATREKLTETVTTQAKDAVDKALSRGIEGAKSLLQTFEEKKTQVSSKLVGGVTIVVGGASSSTTASGDIPISADNQPLLASGERGVETMPWWKNCCGVLDLLKTSSTTR